MNPPAHEGQKGLEVRDSTTGRFAKGNRTGHGNPFGRRMNRLRAAMFRAVTPKDFEEVVAALLREAKGGDVAAIREVVDRMLGKSEAIDLIARIEELETLLLAQGVRVGRFGEQANKDAERSKSA